MGRLVRRPFTTSCNHCGVDGAASTKQVTARLSKLAPVTSHDGVWVPSSISTLSRLAASGAAGHGVAPPSWSLPSILPLYLRLGLSMLTVPEMVPGGHRSCGSVLVLMLMI